jgi:hypothetical protein
MMAAVVQIFFQANTHKLPIAFHFMPGANAGI